ncbi:oxygen-independent coproporphyrinogen-3 oxidase [Clostridium pascui]|uniref:radical SAM family heme chaperone HemW n=1 Tax=Clostridium pascui TaxID=46609 RepID=UPI00195928CA|nr:radical SAM family heme chaperone HemW [Clostridium pascui]MBM7870215.1 oxygen-independent coproporphyrinogen-3 oxidase [Clostridium pascui]
MKKELSLYIHIPFCKQKCLYCDFPSYCGEETLMDSYVDALCTELDDLGDYKFNTIFIGGGTPSHLDIRHWEKLKYSIDKLDKSDDLEFSVEVNPGTVSKEKLCRFKEMGVNRLSIGLQAWQNELLQGIGRIHKLKDFLETYKEARKLHFDNINIDLMFGLPNQTLEQIGETLVEIIKLNPEHISCYSLIIEEGTPFYTKYENDELTLPSEEVEREMYSKIKNKLHENGYNQYEISNFSKPGKECIHNLVYWNLDEYIGCGAFAHSYINHNRYKNVESIKEYIKKINNNEEVKLEINHNTLKDDMEEFMFMGLRKINGVDINEFQKRFNKNIYQVYGKIIDKYLKDKLLILEDNKLYLSPRGIEVSNMIMSDFILTV